jgi:hypothetical protein
MGEKRQRVDPRKSDEAEVNEDQDLAAILAQATADATQSLRKSASEGPYDGLARSTIQDEQPVASEKHAVFITDPHLSMRILSLPILESLVRRFPVPHMCSLAS